MHVTAGATALMHACHSRRNGVIGNLTWGRGARFDAVPEQDFDLLHFPVFLDDPDELSTDGYESK